MDSLGTLWKLLNDYSGAFQALGAIATVIALLIPLFRSPFRSKGGPDGEGRSKHVVSGATESLTQASLQPQVEAAPSAAPASSPPSSRAEQRRPAGRPRGPQSVLEDLNRLRSQLVPPPLSQEVFPPRS